jgi:hypothetical protein
MKSISEVEKRLQCEAQFRSIQSLEAMIPDDDDEANEEKGKSWVDCLSNEVWDEKDWKYIYHN